MKAAAFAMAVIAAAGTAGAATVALYVDSAPNAYGSPDYPAWRDAAWAGAAAGTFVNMAHSVNPANVGTLRFDIRDEVVTSFGDLGRRLTWVYWVPGETRDQLQGRLQIALFNTWDGQTSDFYADSYGQTWLQPASWVDYDADGDGATDGVVGAAGMAWWGAYGVNTPEALEQDLAQWGQVGETWQFRLRLDGQEHELVSTRPPMALVPEPVVAATVSAALLGLLLYLRRRLRPTAAVARL